MRIYIAVRTAFAERKLAEAVRRADDDDGARQIVVLGAGLDTLAVRNPFPSLAIFEVDHPATQAWKRDMLAHAKLAVGDNTRFVAVDFARDSLTERLAHAGFRVDVPAFFVWLGVVPYLTDDAVFQTVDVMRSCRGAEVVFDYANPLEQLDEQARKAAEARADRVAAIGEPFQSSFDSAALHSRLRAAGATSIDDVGPVRIAAMLGRTTSSDAGGHVVDVRFGARASR
jgi:methyltransferase (TIGR00027 family)